MVTIDIANDCRSCSGIRTILASLLKLPYEDGKAKERLKVLRSLLLLVS